MSNSVENLVGKYAYDSNENLRNFFESIHMNELVIQATIPAKGSIKEFLVDGNKITMTSPRTVTYVLDTEIDEQNEQQYKFKSIATWRENKLEVASKSVKDGKMLYRTYEPTEDGLEITIHSDRTDIIPKLYYTRVI